MALVRYLYNLIAEQEVVRTSTVNLPGRSMLKQTLSIGVWPKHLEAYFTTTPQ